MTQAKHTVGGWRTSAATFVASLLTICAAFTPVASGQEPDAIVKLKVDLTCAEPAAANQLLRNADSSGSSLTDILMALDEMSLDATTCVEIRNAASALVLELNDANPGLDPVQSEAAAERMQQVLAEADKRASSMRFEVGPPPRNLTRSRPAQP